MKSLKNKNVDICCEPPLEISSKLSLYSKTCVFTSIFHAHNFHSDGCDGEHDPRGRVVPDSHQGRRPCSGPDLHCQVGKKLHCQANRWKEGFIAL